MQRSAILFVPTKRIGRSQLHGVKTALAPVTLPARREQSNLPCLCAQRTAYGSRSCTRLLCPRRPHTLQLGTYDGCEGVHRHDWILTSRYSSSCMFSSLFSTPNSEPSLVCVPHNLFTTKFVPRHTNAVCCGRRCADHKSHSSAFTISNSKRASVSHRCSRAKKRYGLFSYFLG